MTAVLPLAWAAFVMAVVVRSRRRGRPVRGARRHRRPARTVARRVGMVAAAVLAAVVSPLAAAVVVVAAVAPPAVRARRAPARREAQVVAALPEVVDLFVVAAAAGLTVPLAVNAVGQRAPPPWGRALRAVWASVGRGALLVDALGGVTDTVGDHGAPLVAVLRDAERDGSALLPSLHRLAVDARDLRRRRAEEAARRVPVRLLFPLVACTLPAFALLTVAPLLVGAARSIQL